MASGQKLRVEKVSMLISVVGKRKYRPGVWLECPEDGKRCGDFTLEMVFGLRNIAKVQEYGVNSSYLHGVANAIQRILQEAEGGD